MPRFDEEPQYDTVHAETQVSKFESLMTLCVMFKMITSFYLRGKTRKKKRKKLLIVLMRYYFVY